MSKLWLDGRVKANLKESVPLIGAPEAWAAYYTGKGVKVAVLDTGIDVNHPDFAGVIDGTTSFVPGEDVTDVNGHGTHVASTIVGSGAASGGDYKGVAPGADLYVGKVLGGVEGAYQDSWVMAGDAVGRRVRHGHRQHEPRRLLPDGRHRPAVADGRRVVRAVRHAVRHRRQRGRRASPPRVRPPRR